MKLQRIEVDREIRELKPLSGYRQYETVDEKVRLILHFDLCDDPKDVLLDLFKLRRINFPDGGADVNSEFIYKLKDTIEELASLNLPKDREERCLPESRG